MDGLEERALLAPVAPGLVATLAPALAAPTGVGAQLLYNGTEAVVLVSWGAVAGASEYRVEVSRDGQAWHAPPALYATPKAPNFVFFPGASGLYSFRVRAVAGGATSAPSAPGTTPVSILPQLGEIGPRALPDSAATAPGKAVLVPVLANDRSPGGGTLSVYAVGPAAHGTVAVSGGRVLYTPAPGFSGLDAFTYTVADGPNRRATTTVTVNVTPVTPPATVSVRAVAATTGEPGLVGVPTAGVFRFTRTGDVTKALTVSVEWGGGTARNATDYKYLPATVTFAAGARTSDVVIVPLADGWREGTERVVAQVKFGVGYGVDPVRSAAAVSIKDNYDPRVTDPTV